MKIKLILLCMGLILISSSVWAVDYISKTMPPDEVIVVNLKAGCSAKKIIGKKTLPNNEYEIWYTTTIGIDHRQLIKLDNDIWVLDGVIVQTR
jgi:hypothetical protein